MAKLNKTPLTIRSKRGTEAEITSYTGYQLSGEIAYATDTKDFYVSDGTQFNKITDFPFTGSAQIQGLGTTDSTTSLLVENSNGDDILKVTDDGAVSVSPDYNGGGFSVNSTQGIRSDSPSNAAVKIIRNNNVGYFAMLSYFDGNSVMWQTGTPKSSDNADFAGTEYIIAQSSRSSPAITINTSDNVGIGTTSPTSKLNISGSNNENLLLVESPSNGSILVVTGSGNVGIGTTPTEGRLHVKGEGSNSATTAFLVQNAAGADLLKVVNDGQLKLSGNKPISFFGLQAFEGSNQDGGYIRIAENSFWNSTRINSPTNITEDNDAPDVSAMLQVDSTTKGFLPPRMTTTQINDISEVSAGLIVYDTTINNLKYYDSSSWNSLTGSSGGGGSAFPFTGSAQIQGLGTTSATTALRVENANASSSFEVLDDGRVKLPADIRIYSNTTPFIHNGNSSIIYPDVYIGENAGNFTYTGTGRNVGIGQNALQNLTTGAQNTGIGWYAGKEITEGTNNTFVGAGAGQSVTTGDGNFGIGGGTLRLITTDSFNVGVGTNVFYNLTSGTGNIGLGYQVFNDLVDGDHNIGMGTQAGRFNQGTRNVAIGFYTLIARASGSYNTIIGYQALQNNTEDNNVAIGYQAGRSANAGGTNDTGSNSVFLGYQAYPSDKNDTNEIVIGYQAVGLGSNTAVLGNDNIVTTALKGNVGIGQTSPDAKLHITGEGTTSGTSALKIENATPTTIFDLKDNGQFTVGPSNDSISIASNGRVTIAASNPDLTIGGGNNITFAGGAGSLTGLRTVNRTGEIRVNATQGVRFGNTSLSAGTRVSIVGDNNTTPFGIRQTPGGTTNNILATFISGSGDVVMGITADGGFTATDSTLVKRYVFEHGYSPSPADGMGIGLDLKTENASGTITSVGFIDVIQDDVSADESSMRISVGETTPTEVMRLQSDGNVGIGTTSPDASAILDIASTTKGVVFPRMTSSQRTAISSPTTGLIVYQTDATEGLYIYKSTGWVQII